MEQRIVHGATIDALTPDELVSLIPRPAQYTRIRATETVQLDATGSGDDEVYKVPIGYQFAARRISLNIGGATDPSTGNVALNVAGKFVAYVRSGQFIEYGQPQYGAAVQIPGVQTWGDQQGPYLENGEVFGVIAKGLTASVNLLVILEGILYRPSTERRNHA